MNQLTTKEIQESAEKVMLGLNREYGREIFKMSEPSMNQIKQKIKEIGLSQREISKRLGKNASYLAGVFRSGLSTAKQAELLKDLEVVVGGGTVQSDDEIIADLSQRLADCQDGTSQLRSESDKYFNETQVLDTELCRVNKENNMLCGDLQKLKRELEAMGNFFDQCKEQRWKYKDKYENHLRLNLFLICMIFIGLILWVVV